MDVDTLKVRDIVSPQNLITLSSTDTIEFALKVFFQNKISSAPVIDVNTKECIGLLDILDCVAHLINITSGWSAIVSFDDWEQTWEKNLRFTMQKVSKVIDFSLRNPFAYCTYDTTIMEAIATFATGIHRMVVKDDKGCLSAVLTQSYLLRMLATNQIDMSKHKEWTQILETAPRHLGYGHKPEVIVKVLHTTRTIDAFRQLIEAGVSAVAIVDKDGILRTQLSASDLRTFGTHTTHNIFNIRTLLKPVTEFLEICRQAVGNPKSYLVWALQEAPVEQILKKMNDNRVHRVWIVDHSFNIYGVVSMTDIMQMIINKPKPDDFFPVPDSVMSK